MTDFPALLRVLSGKPAALLLIDLQNDFCSPDGYLAKEKGYDVAYVEPVMQAVRSLRQAARRAGMQVVWLRSHYDFKYLRPAQQQRRGTQGCCLQGSWGADFYLDQPEPQDWVVTKHTFSGFFETDLHARLQQAGIETLVVCGVATNVCVDSTLRDGFFLGYHIVLAEDAVGSNSRAGHEGTLATVRNNIGLVAPVHGIVSAISQSPTVA